MIKEGYGLIEGVGQKTGICMGVKLFPPARFGFSSDVNVT